MFIKVDLRKPVKPKNLERALLKAAEELGLEPIVEDEFRESSSYPYPVYEINRKSVKKVDTKEYQCTRITMIRERGEFELRVNFYKRIGRCVNFGVTTDYTEEKIKPYLEAVSRHL